MRRIFIPLAIALPLSLALACLLSIIGLYTLTRPSHRVIATWEKPGEVGYDGAAYYLSVVESDIDWRGFPLNWSRRYYIYVGRESGTPTYGHVFDYSFHPAGSDLEAHIRQSVVEWSEEGVTFREASGHVMFIPQAMFVGGR
jgi:hypothetical protein